jgi:hypothetical protein
MISRKTLQTAAVIAKTTQTLVGEVISCAGYDFITFFASYVKGDETGLTLKLWALQDAAGTAFQQSVWTLGGANYTNLAVSYALTATGNVSITMDVRGIEFLKLTQGGTANDGTPTGTLAVSYTLKGPKL